MTATTHAETPRCYRLVEDVSDKWTIAAITELRLGSAQFGELRRAICNISPRMLTVTLRKLHRAGLVNRQVGQGRPPTVRYTLTDSGRTLGEALTPLRYWATDHVDQIECSRRSYDATHHRPDAVQSSATGSVE